MSAIADALSGCEATVSGWHVPRMDRAYLLRADGGEVMRKLSMMGVSLDYGDRYEFNRRPEKGTCLCGWLVTEAAIGAIEEQARVLGLGLAAGVIRRAIEPVRASVPVDAGDPAQRKR